MTDFIAAAVAPSKDAAVAHAVKTAREYIVRVLAELAAADWNIDNIARQPNSMTDGKTTYRHLNAVRGRFLVLTTRDRARLDAEGLANKFRAPTYVMRAIHAEEAFVLAAAAMAAEAFDAFVAKLVLKVGEGVTAAKLDGHTWSGSVLTIAKGEAVEFWNTKQIINFSVYGKAFNQWPTRKVK